MPSTQQTRDTATPSTVTFHLDANNPENLLQETLDDLHRDQVTDRTLHELEEKMAEDTLEQLHQEQVLQNTLDEIPHPANVKPSTEPARFTLSITAPSESKESKTFPKLKHLKGFTRKELFDILNNKERRERLKKAFNFDFDFKQFAADIKKNKDWETNEKLSDLINQWEMHIEQNIMLHIPWLDWDLFTKKAYMIIFAIALLLNVGYVAFIATTGASGIRTAANIISSGISLSDSISEGIGIPVGLLDVLVYLLIFSIAKESSIAVLDSILEMPFLERVADFFYRLVIKPLQTLGDFLFNRTLFACNSLTMMTVLLGFIVGLPLPAILALTAFTMFFGNIYMAKYTNSDARDGLYKVLLNFKIPSIFGEFARGNIATALQIFLKAVSTIGLLVFPYYFYVAQQTAQAFDSPSSATNIFSIAMAALSFIRLIAIYYPIPYHHYLKPPRRLKTLIAKDCYGKKFKKLSSEQKQEVGKTFSELKNAEIQKRGGFLKGHLRLFTSEKAPVVQFGFRFSVGIIIGAMACLNPNPFSIVIFTAALLYAFVGAKADTAHAQTMAAIHTKKQMIKFKETGITLSVKHQRKLSNMELFLLVFGVIVAGDSATSDLITTMGSLSIENSQLRLFFLILAFDKLITTLGFNYKKMQGTLTSMHSSHKNAETTITFFKPKPPQVIAINVNKRQPEMFEGLGLEPAPSRLALTHSS